MAYNAGILLGVIVKAHGFDGTVTIKLAGQFRDKIHEMESVYVETDGKPVPFFIAESESAGDLLKVKFDGYGSVDKVTEFIGCRVFLTSPPATEPDNLSWAELIGFDLIAPSRNRIGNVKEVIENPAQILLSVQIPDGREILVPFHEDFIVSFDRKNKVIIMDLPDGLTDIN